jgi:hydrogenase maturation protease
MSPASLGTSPLRIIILGCGNPSRGDDALGTVLLERVANWISLHSGTPVVAVEDFQFQVEHCLDLEGRDLALFVDAAASGQDPFAFTRIQPKADTSFSTHAISPQAVLHAYSSLGHGHPPPSFVVAVRGHSFELGEDLSPEARDNLEAAWSLLERLLNSPTLEFWEGLCTAAPRDGNKGL